jgi:hypothetical protein
MVNKVRCVDCLHFKTRVIPTRAKLSQDRDFSDSKKVLNRLKKEKEGVRVYYCIYNHEPYLEIPKVHEMIKKDCSTVEVV